MVKKIALKETQAPYSLSLDESQLMEGAHAQDPAVTLNASLQHSSPLQLIETQAQSDWVEVARRPVEGRTDVQGVGI